MRTLALLLSLAFATSTAIGATFHVDDFEDGTTQGWSGASPTVIPTGGPAGADDSFLQIISSGETGPGSRLAAFNQTSDWIGDFAGLGATAIEFDMVNFETSASPLEMRVVLFGPASVSNRWTSTASQTIPNDGVWNRYSFSLADITRVQGGSTYDNMFGDIVRVMLRHDAGTPSAQGTVVRARVGVDNIALVGDIGLSCDFDADGFCNGTDIDLLMNSVAAGSNDAQFDLTGDGVVDDLDRDAWLASAGPENGFSDSYLVGDANLDGSTDAKDLNALALTWQSENFDWTKGNFTGANTNVSDLNALALNWQQNVPAAQNSAVPEPSGFVGISLLTVLGISLWRGSFGAEEPF